MSAIPLRVLLIEHDPSDARLLTQELRQAGFEPDVTRVETEADFLAALEAAPDVVLYAGDLPRFDAPRALEVSRAHRPDVPFLIVSGPAGEETAVHAVRNGATDYLLKDRPGRLGPAVRQALAGRPVRAGEDRFQELADSIPQIVWTAGPDGGLDYLNRRAVDYSGVAMAGLTGWSWERIVHPDDLPNVRAVWGEAVQTGVPRAFECRLRRADGEHRWYVAQQRVTRGADGAVARWFGTCTDIHDQKATAARLARDAVLLASVRDSVVVTDPAGVVTYWNDGAARLFGWTAAEMLGRPYADRLPEPARTAVAEQIALRAEGSEWDGEYEDYRKDGTRVWIHARVGRMADATGRVLGILGIAHDITDRTRARAERDRLLETLRVQIRQLPLGYVLTGADLRVVDWNPAAERIFGFRKDEAVGWGPPYGMILPAEEWPAAEAVLSRIRRGELGGHMVCENLTKNGGAITCEWCNTPLFDGDGAFQGVFCLVQDITARHAAERALELRDRAIQAVTQGLLITDPNQRDNPIVYASPACERLTGYAAAEVVGRNCRFLQGEGTDPAAVAQVRAAVRGGRPCTVELLNYRKDGTTFWNSLSVSPVTDPAGRLTHFVGVQTDVTERRRMEAQFRQAQKLEAFGQLAGGVAHDFNNLLTIINGYSDLLLADLPPADPRRDLAAAVREAGGRSAELTAQLLAFSRKTIIEPKVLDLNGVVESFARLLRRLIGEDVKLAVVLSPRTGRVKADPGQLEQVLMNLAVNARDAMPTGGRLTVETADAVVGPGDAPPAPDCPPGRYARLTVSDTGVGMTEEVQRKIFEPFFTTKEVGKGTGLGLATVYGIVTQAGGSVGVSSVAGHGTTFTVLLPAVAHAPDGSGVAWPASQGTETILLVEDEEAVRNLARYALEMQGYTVLEAGCGADAVRAADLYPDPIHLLVADVVMPAMGGREVAEAVRRQRPELRVLYMSGYTDDAVVRYGVIEATDAFLQKPFTPSGLARKVREVLDEDR